MSLGERINKASQLPPEEQGSATPDDSCRFRGPTKRVESKQCCGWVEIFDCSKLGHEVWDTKCRRCSERETGEADDN